MHSCFGGLGTEYCTRCTKLFQPLGCICVACPCSRRCTGLPVMRSKLLCHLHHVLRDDVPRHTCYLLLYLGNYPYCACHMRMSHASGGCGPQTTSWCSISSLLQCTSMWRGLWLRQPGGWQASGLPESTAMMQCATVFKPQGQLTAICWLQPELTRVRITKGQGELWIRVKLCQIVPDIHIVHLSTGLGSITEDLWKNRLSCSVIFLQPYQPSAANRRSTNRRSTLCRS